MTSLAVLLSTFLVAISAIAEAGPFGFDWNSKTLPNYCQSKNDRPTIYDCKLPAMHRYSAFSDYQVVFAEGYGICTVDAFGYANMTNFGGLERVNEFTKTRDVLIEKYGKGNVSYRKHILDSGENINEISYVIITNGQVHGFDEIELTATFNYSSTNLIDMMKLNLTYRNLNDIIPCLDKGYSNEQERLRKEGNNL